MDWIWNPKTKGSGIITCIPQSGKCPNNCADCFFQGTGRSYLEPLNENLPHVPPNELTEGRIVRMNDGNDSNNERELVEKTTGQYEDYFFNTSIPENLGEFSGPVVLTVNPADATDDSFHVVDPQKNLMFVRVRVNMWNIGKVVDPAVLHYTGYKIPVILTFMAYYKEVNMLSGFEHFYEWKKRTTNPYWVVRPEVENFIMERYKDNPFVYKCGYKGTYQCSRCGNCIREYYNAKERMAGLVERQ